MIILRQKTYSKEYYMSYDKPLGHFRKHQDKYLIGGGSLAGAGIGYLSGKKSAKKKAKDSGLEPGTDEYNKYVKKKSIKGAAIGSGVGAVAGAGGLIGKHLYDINHHSKKKIKLKSGDLIKITRGGEGPQIGQHYAVYDGDGGIIDFGRSSEGIGEARLDDIDKDYTSLKSKVWKKHQNPDGTIKNSVYEELMKDPKNRTTTKIKIEPVKESVPREELLKRAKKISDRYTDDKYDWLDNNCEHFARELSTGKRQSSQADGLPGRVAKLIEKIKGDKK